jgi:hypothetical protein
VTVERSLDAGDVDAATSTSVSIELGGDLCCVRIAEARKDRRQFLIADLRAPSSATGTRLDRVVAPITPDPSLDAGLTDGEPSGNARVAPFPCLVRLDGALAQLGRMCVRHAAI